MKRACETQVLSGCENSLQFGYNPAIYPGKTGVTAAKLYLEDSPCLPILTRLSTMAEQIHIPYKNPQQKLILLTADTHNVYGTP